MDDTTERTTFPVDGLYLKLNESSGSALQAGTEYSFMVTMFEAGVALTAAGGTFNVTIPAGFTGVEIIDDADFGSDMVVSGSSTAGWTINDSSVPAISLGGENSLVFNATTPTGYKTTSLWFFNSSCYGCKTDSDAEDTFWSVEPVVVVQPDAGAVEEITRYYNVFSLSSIPSDATITGANLTVFVNDSGGVGEVYHMNESYISSTSNQTIYEGAAPNYEVESNPVTTFTTTVGEKIIDVTAAVNESFVNGTANLVGFQIREQGADALFGINDSNLTIYYNTPQETNVTVSWNISGSATGTYEVRIKANSTKNTKENDSASNAVTITSGGDSTPPTYSNNQTNATAAGESVNFSVYYTDETALHPNGLYVFSTNNTGTWVNDSQINFTSTGEGADVIKTLNSTAGISIGYRWYANDSAGNNNNTELFTLTITAAADSTAPQWFNNSTNSTLAGTNITHSLNWTDETALGGYVFSFDNGTGTFVNDSFVAMIGIQNWSNVTKGVNSTGGSTIRWQVYTNDSSNNLNATGIFQYTTISYGFLNVSISLPTNNTNVSQNETFTINATITCSGNAGSICGTVDGLARYNLSGAAPDTDINTTGGATPLYIEGGSTICFQESADIATGCGGLATGTYSVNNSWNDENYGTFVDTVGIRYVNYTKPVGAVNAGTKWQVKENEGDPESLEKSTLISTPEGEKRIDKLEVGESIYSYDFNKEEIVSDTVVESRKRFLSQGRNAEQTSIYNINNKINATGNHIFYINDGTWEKTINLKQGDEFLLFNGSKEIIKSVKLIDHQDDYVYSLSVNKNPNYFAEEILNHNFAQTVNISLSEDCFNQNPIQLKNEITAFPQVIWSCFDGSSWDVLRTRGGIAATVETYEEAIYWQIASSSNPESCGDMNATDSCNLSWTVNATGSPSTEYKVEVLFNSTTYYPNTTENDTEDRTIRITGNSAPTIGSVETIGATDPSIGTNKSITFNFTATDTDGAANINTSSAQGFFQRAGESTRSNTTCVNWSSAGNDVNFTCTVDMWYFDENGAWTINVTVADDSSESAENSSTTFTYNILTAMVMSPSSLAWPEINLPDTDIGSNDDPVTINNSGNDVGLGINVTAYNLQGEITATEYIYANNFTIDNVTQGCSGTAMANATSSNVTSALLQRGNNSLNYNNATSGQEQIFFCLKGVPQEISSQPYSSAAYGAWEIRILLVAVIPRKKRKKKSKKKSIENDDLLKIVGIISDELKEKYKLSKAETMNILIKELGRKYRVTKKEILSLDEFEKESVPTAIFSKELGALESLVKYMKENLNMSYGAIAKELERDERTIWTAYKKAKEKMEEAFELKDAKETLPLSIFENKKLTVLESIVLHLKEKGMRYSEVAKLLKRDQRNIWTIYSRAIKKLEKIGGK